jgi:hypothetical protein
MGIHDGVARSFSEDAGERELLVRVRRSLVWLVVLIVAGCAAPGRPRVQAPTVPLPEVDEPIGGALLPVSNSLRAWSYKRPTIEPLLQLGKALYEEPHLPPLMNLKIMTVVASRNHCFY